MSLCDVGVTICQNQPCKKQRVRANPNPNPENRWPVSHCEWTRCVQSSQRLHGLREEHRLGKEDESRRRLTGSARRNLPLHLTHFNGFETDFVFSAAPSWFNQWWERRRALNKEQQLPGVNLRRAKPGAPGRSRDTFRRSNPALKHLPF